MQTKEIISNVQSYVDGAQDSSSFILLHEHSKVFKNYLYKMSWKMSVRESDCPENVR